MTKKHFFRLLLIFIGWRVGLLLIGVGADSFLTYAPSFPYFDSLLPSFTSWRWWYSWANFDGVHYLTIGQKGYIGTGLVQAFFPLLPYVAMHLPKLLLGEWLNLFWWGMALTQASSFGLILVWFSFVKGKMGDAAAWLATWLLLLFPTAFFFGALYTESIFLLVVLAAFYAAEKRWWWLVFLTTVMATSARVVGAFLIPALVVDVWLNWRNVYASTSAQKSSLDKRSLWFQLKMFVTEEYLGLIAIVAGGVGLVSYMFFLFLEFRDPLYFLHVQHQFGSGRQESFVFYPQVIWRYMKILAYARPFDLRYLSYIQEMLAGSVGLLLLLLSWKRVKTSYLLFGLGAFILPTLTGTFSSMPRYILVCFPVFLLLTEWLKNKPKVAVWWLSVSTFWLILNTILFIQGYWVA